MPKSDHITFEPEEQKDGSWAVAAYCPGYRGPTMITRFKSEYDAVTWIEGPRSAAWKKAWGTMYD